MPQSQYQHWSQFWQQGHITTFGKALSNNYEGNILNFWQQRFAQLPHAASVLDVATGNGALAHLAARFARDNERDWQLFACDIAQIEEDLQSEPELRRSIAFSSDTPCENLPYPNAQFDLVTSQFGIEYSAFEQSLTQIYRVLKPGGIFAAICHHAHSNTLLASQEELAIYHQALDEANIFQAAIAYLDARAQQHPEAPAKLQAVNLQVNALRQRYAGNPCCDQMVATLTVILKGTGGASQPAIKQQLRHAEDEFRGAARRLQDLVGAALSATNLEKLAHHSKALGFVSIEIGVLEHAPEELAGHTFIAKR